MGGKRLQAGPRTKEKRAPTPELQKIARLGASEIPGAAQGSDRRPVSNTQLPKVRPPGVSRLPGSRREQQERIDQNVGIATNQPQAMRTGR